MSTLYRVGYDIGRQIGHVLARMAPERFVRWYGNRKDLP